MANEYVIYWRREVLYRSKIIADSTEDALIYAANDLLSQEPSLAHEDLDEIGPMKIDNVELIEKDVL